MKWHPSRPDLMATACIYNGFKIIGGLLSSPSIMGTYSEHGSLAYGIDWMADSPQSHGSWALSCDQQTNQTDSTEHQKEWVLASCSFYDHALHLWSGKEK